MTWNEALEEELISMVEERPPLYNVSEKSYSNRTVKTDCWRQITEKCNLSGKIFSSILLCVHPTFLQCVGQREECMKDRKETAASKQCLSFINPNRL